MGQAQVSLTTRRVDLLQAPSCAGSQTESAPALGGQDADDKDKKPRHKHLKDTQWWARTGPTHTHPHTHSWGLAGTVGSPSGSRGRGGRGYLSPVTNAQRHSETYNWDPTKPRLAQNTHTPSTSRHSSTAHAGTARRTGVPWAGRPLRPLHQLETGRGGVLRPSSLLRAAATYEKRHNTE